MVLNVFVLLSYPRVWGVVFSGQAGEEGGGGRQGVFLGRVRCLTVWEDREGEDEHSRWCAGAHDCSLVPY